MNKSIELDGNLAGIMIQALEDWVEVTRDRAEKIITGTNSRMAGFNLYDDVNAAEAVIEELEELFPPLDCG